eukprot:gnl/TRDRNA2_/TRDRNA2_192520_c0_seq1.p2 gnl/TRDRNA2_/TRDRNA2_192520_c0~~gnl/TRDRNA2_/TRDRNA2_192520_c0_seq1.p2  ORF type:complete len:119 (+),score=4.87 gnl/TRDRNA2_/TRDRNA2_192520_c0_seq1:51-407(+)
MATNLKARKVMSRRERFSPSGGSELTKNYLLIVLQRGIALAGVYRPLPTASAVMQDSLASIPPALSSSFRCRCGCCMPGLTYPMPYRRNWRCTPSFTRAIHMQRIRHPLPLIQASSAG